MNVASTEEVEALADEWSDKVVHCRIYGHSWKPLTVVRILNGFTVKQRCPNCRNTRSQDMDVYGSAGAWRYEYVEGYLTKDLGRIDNAGRNVLRIAAIRHATIIDSEEVANV